MARQVNQIRIESILGGHSPSTHFAAENQFLTSFSIDPSFGIGDSSQDTDAQPCGLLRPVGGVEVSAGTITAAPLWIRSTPKVSSFYIYDAAGSVYTATNGFTSVTGLGDLNDGGSSQGNGMAYYDNYVYFARDTTIARYGPLDSSPTFTDDYWVGTLGKTALENTVYQSPVHLTTKYPNHVLHRHSDGRLYIADVVGNRGTLHYIETDKTTVEGDTDSGSTYDALNLGYGLYPTDIESYGEFLVIALIESFNQQGFSSLDSRTTAKIAFWDTTSTDANQIIWVEYPDPMISGIRNQNGVLYFISGNVKNDGYRVMRYLGGSSFQEVFYSSIGPPPLPGAIDGEGDTLVFGSKNEVPLGTTGSGENACVWQLGLKNQALGSGIFNVRTATTNSDTAIVTALSVEKSEDFNQKGLAVAWADDQFTDFGLDRHSTSTYSTSDTQWYSQIYKIGSPFKITKIRIPLAQKLTANMSVTPYAWIDGIDDTNPDYTELTTINSTNFGTNTRSCVIRPENLKGDYSFSLSLKWTGSALCVVALPIIIEYELIDVDTQYP